MRHVAALPLSASQRLAIVEVGSGAARRWLVLGVSSQSITTLHTMEPQADAAPSAADDGTAFAQLLSRMKRGS
jgi:flagellar protein FliO/FliZ